MDPITSNSINPLVSTNTPVFGDNVQDLLNAGLVNVKPTGIIVVNSIADVAGQPGATTLRDAINKANADPVPDLIVFDRSLFSKAQTITLSRGELDITHNLDIIAPRDTLTGSDLVTVSGSGASRVFEIEKAATVNLSGLIVADGRVTGDDGGGIKNSGILTLDSSIVRNNSTTVSTGTTFPGGYGGGIFNNIGASLTVSNSTINGNSASNGGDGIANNKSSGSSFDSGSTLEVKNSTIRGNSGGRDGGGILSYGDNSIIKVSNSTISGNSSGYGAGIFLFYGTADVSNSIISNNSANFGGGINSFRAILKVSDSTISYNSAIDGGGIDNDIRSAGNFTVISHTTITNNSATGGRGGGIENFNDFGETFKISNSTISNNSSASDGGGIYSSGNVEVDNSTVSNNSAKVFNGFSGNGGGIYGSGTISNSTLSGNTAAGSGGGIYGSGTISNSTISNNSSASDGGGIYNPNGGTVQLSNSTLSNNKAANNGGGIYNTTVETQVSRTGFIAAQGIVNATNSTLSGNTAGNTGGGIYSIGAVTLLFDTLTLNQAANGGGVFNGVFNGTRTGTTPGTVSSRNTIIAANRSSAGGVNPDIGGTFTSIGYNLIGNSTGSTGFGVTGDIVGTSANPINPGLDSLKFNGGPTQTIALLKNSPAINAGDPTGKSTDPTTDQRGKPRVSGGRSDIGAFELS
ncbi:MAG: hypothetical protein DSM106950_11050 [Stigonema ocellatum SAG 48.90 = DSM 106950]|nr:hypothetical protein [Stigonema ocellatum SAG 48.90 = DSM 106950]